MKTCLVYETSEHHARVASYVGMETGHGDGGRHALNFPEALEMFKMLCMWEVGREREGVRKRVNNGEGIKQGRVSPLNKRQNNGFSRF